MLAGGAATPKPPPPKAVARMQPERASSSENHTPKPPPPPQSQSQPPPTGAGSQRHPSQSSIQLISKIPKILPLERVFPIQIGSELFKLSGASISSDGECRLLWLLISSLKTSVCSVRSTPCFASARMTMSACSEHVPSVLLISLDEIIKLKVFCQRSYPTLNRTAPSPEFSLLPTSVFLY